MCCKSGFNRTFMELKPRKNSAALMLKEVLIGPSWN